jgi:hypothetical protein
MQMRLSGCFIAAVVAVAIAAPALAESLEVRKMRAQQEAELATALALTNGRCGGALTATIDWSSFDEAETLKSAVKPYCQAALDAIEDLCGDDMVKQAINEKVKTVTCVGASEPSASLVDGNLSFKFSLTPNQNKLLVRDYLGKNL